MAYTRIPLSGAAHGAAVSITATSSTAGTVVHTATTSATLVDVVTLYAHNSSTSGSVTLTLNWSSTAAANKIVQDIPNRSGLIPVEIDGLIRNTLVIDAAASVTAKIAIHGFVNRSA